MLDPEDIAQALNLLLSADQFYNCIETASYQVPARLDVDTWGEDRIVLKEELNWFNIDSLIVSKIDNGDFDHIKSKVEELCNNKNQTKRILINSAISHYGLFSILKGAVAYWHSRQGELIDVSKEICSSLYSDEVSIDFKNLLGNSVIFPNSIKRVQINDRVTFEPITEDGLYTFYKSTERGINYCLGGSFYRPNYISAATLTWSMKIKLEQETVESNYQQRCRRLVEEVAVRLNSPISVCQTHFNVTSFIPISKGIGNGLYDINLIPFGSNFYPIIDVAKAQEHFEETDHSLVLSDFLSDFEVVSERLYFSLIGYNTESKIVDLAIALEALLLNRENENGIKAKLKERVAVFVSENKRSKVAGDIGKLYKLRSEIVHGNSLKTKEELNKVFKDCWDIIRSIYLFSLKIGKMPDFSTNPYKGFLCGCKDFKEVFGEYLLS